MKAAEVILLLAVVVYVVIESQPKPKPKKQDVVPDTVRTGCTDPFAMNWDPTAKYSIEVTSLETAMNQQVCQNVDPTVYGPGIFLGKNAVRRENGSVNDYSLNFVCYDDRTDEIVLRDGYRNPNDPENKKIHPNVGCFEGEYFVGVLEKDAIMVKEEREAYPETDHSTGDAWGSGISVYKPQEGDRFEPSDFFDHIVQEHNPGYGPNAGDIPNLWQRSANYWHSQYDQSMARQEIFDLLDVLRQRTEQAQAGNADTWSDVYFGRLMRVGDPAFGAMMDLDFDKSGYIGASEHSASGYELKVATDSYQGYENFMGMIFPSIQGPMGDVQGGPQIDGFTGPNGELNEFVLDADLDKDHGFSIWEHFVFAGTSLLSANDSSYLGFNDVVNQPIWDGGRHGVLGYDGIACSKTEGPFPTETACFALTEEDKMMLEMVRTATDEKHGWYKVNDADKFSEKVDEVGTYQMCIRELDALGPDFKDALSEWTQYHNPGVSTGVGVQLLANYCILESLLLSGKPYDKPSDYYDHWDYINMAETPGGGINNRAMGNMSYDDDIVVPIPPIPEFEEELHGIEMNIRFNDSVQSVYGVSTGFLNPDPGFKDHNIHKNNAESALIVTGSYPYAYGMDLGIARDSCPASHPHFVRYCNVSQTSDSLVEGPTPGIIDPQIIEQTLNEIQS